MQPLLAVWIVLALLVSSCKKEHKFYGYLYDKPAYDFELTSQDGNRVRLSQFLKDGGVVLLFFGYTHCPDVCPTALSTMAKVMKNLSEKEREKVKVLFVSVDPERDTPAVLKNYITPDMKIKLLYTTNRQDPQKIAEDIRYLLSS